MTGPEKGNPQETQLAGEVSRGFDEASKLPSRVERYGKAKARSVQMIAHVQQVQQVRQGPHLDTLSTRMNSCGEFLHFRHYYTSGLVRLHAASFCKVHLLCPLCAIRRGAKMLKAYLDRYQVLQVQHPQLVPHLVTLTVKNGDDLGERFEHLRAGMRKLQARRRDVLKKGRGQSALAPVQACVGSYEFTNKGKGWHPHVHMIALSGSGIDQEALAAEWKAITGDSWIVDVRPFRADQEPAEAFLEVFKYAVKFSDLDLALNFEAFETLRGKRLLFSFGLFRGVEVPEDLTDEPLDDLPFVDLFYRYLHGRGYQFEAPPQAATGGRSEA